MLVFVVCFALCSLVSVSAQSPLSPCPETFHYETDGAQWFGIVYVPSPPMGSTINLNLKMSIKARLPTKYVGRIELSGRRADIIGQIIQRDMLKYKVYFPLLTIIPKVTSIMVNKNSICTGPPARGLFVTTINLSHVISTGKGNKDITSSQDYSETVTNKSGPESTAHKRKPDPDNFATSNQPDASTINTVNAAHISKLQVLHYNKSSCGLSKKSSNALIIGGESTDKGDWPWLTAIFVKKESGLSFICAGSLVSNRHVVTAAHCVHKKNNRPVKVEELVLKLGVFNLQDWSDTAVKIIEVKDILLHPSFDGGLVLNFDISILKINPIMYTDYIMPVCLWEGDNDLQHIIGKHGSVVGWGRDENGLSATPEPRLSVVPIVSTSTCRESKIEFLYLTSEYTLCAGGRDGSGPCNGDSGGGLFIFLNSRWFLRGIVSASLKDAETQSCDLNEYVVFTDAAKYAPWIKSIISRS